MSERTRVLVVSIGIMVTVSASAVIIALYMLYGAAFDTHKARLEEVARSRARLIAAVGRFDAQFSQRDVPGGASAATLRQVVEAHEDFEGFGETGEFTLARREDDKIAWLLRHRHAEVEVPKPTPLSSELAEPMRRALAGESGTLVGLDYRGAEVLAAYEFIPELGWGVVAKIDTAEIRKPFTDAALLAVGIALAILVGGGAWMFRAASPVVRRLEVGVAQRTAELLNVNRSLEEEILERQQTERALRRMSKVFMEATVPMSIQDLSGRIIDINPEAGRTYGWSRDELLEQPIDKIVPPERLQQQHELAARCIRGEMVRNVEGRRQTRSGEVVPVLLTLSLLTDEEGGSQGIVTIAKDLTQQKRLEEQLRAAAGEATMAEERERRKLAVDLHDGIGQLLALTSMKLGALRTFVEAFGLDPEVRELEEIVVEVQRRARSLVFQLSPPTLHDVGLVAAAHSLAEDMQRRFGLHVSLEETGERQSLDETSRIALFRALSELLTNVAKHGETEYADVRFAWQDGHVEITIEDEGAGFDAGAPTSGYGLFSIRERLARLGGSAQIDSSPGKGARIVLTAPITAAEEDTDTGLA